ncbi:SagB/ThcOx family dehydrogenase, partial [candidate division GN15 bacterium]|nr:SagB/ThcOx family dehydrogenase [candidate division GN15 bacterium]
SDTPPEPIGQRFHHLTSFTNQGYVSDDPHWGSQLPLYKSYPDAPRVSLTLPDPAALSHPQGLPELVNKRRSTRSYSDEPVSLQQLSRVLLSANGLTRMAGGSARRTAPSAGALYPIDIYIVVSEVTELEQGLYHFNPEDSSLSRLESGDVSDQLSATSESQDWVGPAPATLILSARFPRVTAKYADRGYRYAYIECGAIAQNIYLQTTALGMGTVTVGAFNDQKLNEFLDVDGVREAGILIMPIGHRN